MIQQERHLIMKRGTPFGILSWAFLGLLGLGSAMAVAAPGATGGAQAPGASLQQGSPQQGSPELEERQPEQRRQLTGVDYCMACHGYDGAGDTTIDDNGLAHNIYVDPERFGSSVHYTDDLKDCLGCHVAGFTVFPHENTSTKTCLNCHEDHFPEYEAIKLNLEKSVHNDNDKAHLDCSACHSPHAVKRATQATPTEKNMACIDCHEGRFNESGESLLERHSWHPMAKIHLYNLPCIACHSQPDESQPGQHAFKHLITRDGASRDCNDCHEPSGKMPWYLAAMGAPPDPDSFKNIESKTYLTGSSRNSLLDMAALLLLAATFLGCCGHGFLRYFFARRRAAQ